MGSESEKSHGQMFSIDFLAAVLVFIICLAFINSFWQDSVVSANAAAQRNGLAASAFVASGALLSGPGEPADWEKDPASARSLGLALQGSPNELDAAKLSAFAGMDSAAAMRLLGLRSQYYFVADGVGSPIHYESGNASLGGTRAIGITRYASLNSTIVRVSFFVHQ